LLIVNLGRKIERTLELAMWAMLIMILGYLLVLDLATVSGETWGRLARGFLSFGTLPAEADWALLAAFAAYSGLGGMSNVFVTNWMRDKGHGMGATVGYIPTLAGGRVQLSPHGNVFPVNEASLGAWRRWWKFMNVDQWAIFAVGSIAGMALTCVLTLQFVAPGSATGEWAIAGAQAAAVAARHGPLFWYLTLACGFWVLFSTQLGIVDGTPRAMTDILWSGSAAVRRWRGGDVRAVYYGSWRSMPWGCGLEPGPAAHVGDHRRERRRRDSGVHQPPHRGRGRTPLPPALRPRGGAKPRWSPARCSTASHHNAGGHATAPLYPG
jgi:hypothetical protein